MAKSHYSADSAFMPPSRAVFGVSLDLLGTFVFVFERGYVPARESAPIIPFID